MRLKSCYPAFIKKPKLDFFMMYVFFKFRDPLYIGIGRNWSAQSFDVEIGI